MRSETRLDFAVFQLTPTRTRCELLVSAGGVTEKLASGLLKPFLAHLKAAEEEIERGGYSIKLVPFFADSANVHGAAWFTKGTIERFVRFVSTPEVLERVSSVEAELVQIEEAISIQANEARVDEQYLRTSPATPPLVGFTVQGLNTEKGSFSSKSRRNSVDITDVTGGDSSKWRLLRAMDARRLMLQKEQGMAFARAAAAGFDMEHMEDLIAFADCFGATRLREACVKFLALCKKRQEAGLWMEEMEMAAAEAAANRMEGPEYVQGLGNFSRGKEYNDTWSDANSEAGDESRDDMSMRSHNSFYRDGRGFAKEEDLKRRRSSQEDGSGDIGGDYGPAGGYRPRVRYSQGGGMVPLSVDELQASSCGHDMLGRTYNLSPGGYQVSRVSMDPSMYQGEHGYEYRDLHAQGARAVIANQSPRYIQGYHGNSPSTSPASRQPSWVPPEEELNYDSQGNYGAAQQSGRGNMHGPLPNGHHVHYGTPGLHSDYADVSNSLPWRQGESHGNWASQQPPPPPQYWQGNAGYGDESRAQNYRDPMRAPESQYINSSPAHQRGSRSPDMRGLSNTKGVSVPCSEPFVKPQSPATEELGEVQPELQLPAPNAQFAQTPAAAQQFSEGGVASAGRKDLSSPSPGRKQALSPMDSANRGLARRSTSPRRRASSPLRKVQVGRSGVRRSGLVVIRNINYITSSSQDRCTAAEDRGSDNEFNDSEGEEDTLQQKTEQVRFSVKDAIKLFEKKRKESGDAVKKLSRRGSTGSGSSSFNERVKQWSEASDASAGRTKEESPYEDSDVQSKQGSCTVDRENHSIVHNSKSEEDEVESCPTHVMEQDEGQTDASFGLVRGRGGRTDSMSLPQFDAEVSSYQDNPQVVEEELPSEEMILPEKDEKRSQKKSQFPIDEVDEEGKADDSFMLPNRDQQMVRGCRAVSTESEIMSAQVKDTVQDDSFIVLARLSTQDQTSNWRTAVDMESEISTDQENAGGAVKETVDISSFTEDLMFIPERNTRRDSSGKRWNTQAEYDMGFYEEEEDKDDDEKSVVGENESPKNQQGRFYEQYREKRDAKLREQPGPKRAEREAKLKAMEEVLEKQKAEMTARTGRRTSEGTKYAVKADAQLRADKLRQYKACLLESKRKKEEEERKRIDEIRMQRRERIAARSSPTPAVSGNHSASSTPRATRQTPTTPKANSRLSPSKNLKVGIAGTASRAMILSSPKAIPGKTATVGATTRPRRAQNASAQGAAVAAENPLSRSVPSLVDLRKENTKPTGRSSLGDKVGGSARIQAKLISSMHRSKSANDASPLEANGGLSSRSIARATDFSDDKKRPSVSSRKSIATVTELKTSTNSPSTEIVSTALKARKETVSEPVITRVAKRTLAPTAGPQDAKPFLRKGTGIGPGSGAVIRKLKSSQVFDTSKSIDEDGPEAFFLAAAVAEREVFKDEALSQAADSAIAETTGVKVQETPAAEQSHDVTHTSGNGTSQMPLRAPPSSAQEESDSTLEKADASTPVPQNLLREELLAVYQVGEEALPRPPESTDETKPVDEVQSAEAPESPIRGPAVPVTDNRKSQVNPLVLLPPAESKFTAFPQVSNSEDYNAPLALASPSPSQATRAPNVEDYDFVLASPSDTTVPCDYETTVAVAMTFPTASPASRTFPQLQRSLSPDPNKQVDTSKSRKKGGNYRKSSSVQQASKDTPRGFKRLLNFGRRSSKGNTGNAVERVSASTASEGDDDADEFKVGGSRLSAIPNKVESGSKNARPRPTSNGNGNNNLRYMGDSPESGRTDLNGSGDRGSVPRSSFFSLSSFRSKNDSKYRA
ncbi:hypothetical protein R1flu_008631 [Riccia fluitans]|uniref:COP1-interacting protein 7 n=1 Tax=Riccia fluitans TaxID=41844 RepID=A0ABD1YC89_9MARC